jgi:hypothetical protein
MSFWTFALILILLAIIFLLIFRPTSGGIAVDAAITGVNRLVRLLRSKFKRSGMLAFPLFILLAGCAVQPNVRPLPPPRPETPVCNLPKPLHQRNKLGPLGQGSCVHASLVNHLRWLNEFELAQRWWATYGDGEYASRLMQRMDAAGIDYAFTEKADPRFLDYCTVTRTGAILWWKPSHCCTFEGFAMGQDIMKADPRAQGLNPNTQYACILDNNYPGTFEYTERQQFIRLWAGYGGFALCVMRDPTISIPYLSYETY